MNDFRNKFYETSNHKIKILDSVKRLIILYDPLDKMKLLNITKKLKLKNQIIKEMKNKKK